LSSTLDRIREKWRDRSERMDRQESPCGDEGFAAAFFPGLTPEESERARQLKRSLLETFRGARLEEALPGEEHHTSWGSCYRIQTEEALPFRMIRREKARNIILSDLKLIYGIGVITERDLKKKGYRTIADLAAHPRFGTRAAAFLDILDAGDTDRLCEWIGRWFSRSHPLILHSSGLHDREDFLILDIETLGLFTRPIILFGAARISGNRIRVDQYLLRDIHEEPAALAALLAHVGKRSAFVTFNGRAFDVPYIRERLAYYRMTGDLERAHYDVLHFSRRAWRDRAPNCRLTTLETFLFGMEREDDVPSALVPEFYETYRRTGNVGPLVPIIRHNRDDLITLARIFSRLHEEWER
jgi:uncharacterized protein YprB with RNaseH-like and TPR domain